MSEYENLVTVENNVVFSKCKLDFELSSVPRAIFNKLETIESKEILVDCATADVWTAKHLLDAITTVGIKLIELGVKKGDVFAFFCPNSDLHTISLLAVISVGAIYTGNLPKSPLREMQNTIMKSSAKYVVLTKHDLDKSQELRNMQSVQKLFVIDDDSDTIDHISVPLLLEDKCLSKQQRTLFMERMSTVEANDLMQIGFSSGTTGPPKAVSRTHANNLAVLAVSAPKFDLVTEDDVVGVSSSFIHMSGICMLINALCKGAKAVVIDFGDANNYLNCLQKASVSVIFMVPSTVNFLNKQWTQATSLTIRKVIVAGEALSEEVAKEFITKFKPIYFGQSFGSSEMGFATMKPFSQSTENLKSNGIPVAEMQLKICDLESRVALSFNEVGEICVKGTQVSKGYLNNENANKESYDDDGYFRTGDAGYIDANANLFFSSRFKEIIQYDANPISPSELEFILLEHEAVREAAVIGIPDEQFGQLPKAFVVLDKKFEKLVTEQHLKDFVSQNVSDYKQLRGGIQFLTGFKKTTIGKIDRKALKSLCS